MNPTFMSVFSLTILCTGTSAKCPMPEPKADGSLCNSDTQVCRSGVSIIIIKCHPYWHILYPASPQPGNYFEVLTQEGLHCLHSTRLHYMCVIYLVSVFLVFIHSFSACVGSGVVKIDPLRFLAGCHTR